MTRMRAAMAAITMLSATEAPGIAMAAPQAAAQARGEISISVSVAATVRVGGMTDTFASDAAHGEPCMWSNTATRGYSVTTDGATVTWMDAGGPRTIIAKGDAPIVQTSGATSPTCRDGRRSSMAIDTKTATPGQATTLIIAPQ